MRLIVWFVAIVILASAGPALATDESLALYRLRRLHTDLTADQPLDRSKLERLRRVALEDDLMITAAESKLLSEFVRQGYQDPTGEPAPDINPTFDAAPKGWVERARRWLIEALRGGVGTGRTERALKQLVALAWRDDLKATERDEILQLLDNLREIDPAQRSRDAYEALGLILTNPDQARRDENYRRSIETLARKANMPSLFFTLQATASPR